MSWADIRGYYIERDDERPDCKMLRSSEHTARKQHRCDCGDVIAVGERYRAEVFLLDGELQHSKVGLGHVHSWDREIMEAADKADLDAQIAAEANINGSYANDFGAVSDDDDEIPF